MVEDGSERENGRLSTMDSIESRSVFQDEDKSEIEDEEDDEDLTPRISMDSDDDDNSEQRLIRQALRSIPSMSKHLRSPEHNGATLRWEYVMEYSSDINFLLGGQKLPPSSVIEDPKTVLKKVEEPTCLKSAWELLEIFYADKHSQAGMPERLLDWLADYDSLLSGTQPTVHSKLVNFQKDLVSLQEIEVFIW